MVEKSSGKDTMYLQYAYRGTLVGAILGDCLGKPWEQSSWLTTFPLVKIKAKIPPRVADGIKMKKPLPYTDDSAMTLALATSLVECKGFDAKDVAKKFQEEFHREPWRGYGMSVVTVFDKLRFEPEDVFLPAREQHGGEGSYGNGSAMRISPIALICKTEEELIKCAKDSAALTHAHVSAIAGGILQALAVKKALDLHKKELNRREFVEELLEKMKKIETVKPGHEKNRNSNLPTYQTQLETILKFLDLPEPPSQDEVFKALGHGISAAEAVPCAIYAFIHCSSQTFDELIPYAISLGGDTDTIASMAGAIGGAYWGIKGIPKEWIEAAEATEKAVQLADRLYDLVHGLEPR